MNWVLAACFSPAGPSGSCTRTPLHVAVNISDMLKEKQLNKYICNWDMPQTALGLKALLRTVTLHTKCKMAPACSFLVVTSTRIPNCFLLLLLCHKGA